MELKLIYVAIYLVVVLLSLWLVFKLNRLHSELQLKGFKYLIIALTGIMLFSIISIIDYYSEVIFRLDEKPFYIYDFIMVISLIITFLSIFYLVEITQKDHITWRFYTVIFLSGGSLVAEALEPMPISYIISSTFEIAAMLLLVYLVFSYAKELKPYVVNYNYYIIGTTGLALLAISLAVGVLSQFAYVFTEISIYDVISELSAIVTVVGLYLIIFAVTLKPLSVFAILAKPKALIILTDEGDPLYEYYFNQNLLNIERKNLRDLIIGVYITIKNMLKKDTYIQSIKTNNFSITGTRKDSTVALLLTERTTLMVKSIVETIHEIFTKELAKELTSKEPKTINLEKLGKFDHIVKYYLTQLIR